MTSHESYEAEDNRQNLSALQQMLQASENFIKRQSDSQTKNAERYPMEEDNIMGRLPGVQAEESSQQTD